MTQRSILSGICLLLPTVALAAAPKFTSPPSAAREGAGVKIAFAVDAPTDVAVYVVDAAGKVVRHLAAGVIGGDASPPPPLVKGLAQSLVWDGKDDAGRPVPGGAGACKVRVAAGLSPTFDGFWLYDPDATPAVGNIAVAPGGIYAFYKDPTANGNQGGLKIALLDRDGHHVRMLMPFPADLPFDRVKATGAFQDEAGRIVPRIWNWHTLNLYPDPQIARYRSCSPFSLPVADAKGRVYWIVSGARLAALDSDGGVPYDTFISDPLVPADAKGVTEQLPALTLSGDGASLYLSGLGSNWRRDGKRMIYTGYPCVLRVDIATRKAAVFVGKPDQPGNAGDLLTAPRGLAVAKGLLYVADPAAGRVAVFRESDGSPAGELKVASPQTVDVDPRTGAVYVCSYTGDQSADLVKFDGYAGGKELCRVKMETTGLSPNGGTHRVAGDFAGERPRFWVPALPYGRSFARLGYYEDTGEAFVPHDMPASDKPWANGPRDLVLDRDRGELYVKVQGERWLQIRTDTGRVERTVAFPKNFGGPYAGSSGAELGIDSAGNYVTHCWGENSGLMRWTRDLQPFKWDGRDTHRTDWGGMMTFQLNYMAVHKDLIYVIKPVQGPHHLDVYDMGLNLKRRVVWNVRRGSCPRVDAAGNVYVTMPLRPLDRDFPAFFDGKIDKAPDYYRSIGEGNYWYTYMVAAIVKFPPVGGAFEWLVSDREKNDFEGLPAEVARAPKVKAHYFQGGRYPHRIAQVQGADWIRFGYAPYSETYPAGTPVCMCEGTGFDVDGFGRVFYPNLLQFRVEVIDTANNPIATFGHYGNQDSGGPDAKVKSPAIPMAWPTYVAVDDGHAYVNDTINMRVTRVKLDYAADVTCDVK
ncbi:MAG: hypothetical protein BIFFINMI_01290 [Phycisphaerae bacterium]|nr:hypothetical protein [Phycisphaerae bacterium]